MADLFNTKAVEIGDPTRPKAAVTIKAGGDSLSEYDIILLSITGSGEVNLQFDMNFSNDVFVTVFGDKLTALSFSGIVLANDWCPDSKEEGGKSLMAFFNKYKASADPSRIAEITISHSSGDFVFKGVLVRVQTGPYTQKGANGYTFTLTVQGQVME